MIIINHKGSFYKLINNIDIICCIFSAHFYIWIATFGTTNYGFKIFVQIALELTFLFNMIVNFLVDFVPPGENESEKSLSVIAERYFKNDFVRDLVPLLPINAIFSGLNGEDKYFRLFYLIKVVRVFYGLKHFDISLMINNMRQYFLFRSQEKMKNDQEVASDQLNDHNGLFKQLMIGYFLRIFKLIIVMMNISYFIGLFYLIFC